MKGCRAAWVVLVLLCLGSLARADDVLREVSEPITERELRATVGWLADDERGGRGVVGGGLEEAANFLAERFGELGLEQLPGLSDYSQRVPLPFSVGYESTNLAAGDAPLPGEFVPFGWSEPGEFEGELAFAGYGVSRKGYDDYAEIDVRGKVALVLRYEPLQRNGDSRLTGERRVGRDATFRRKSEAARAAGAAALLIVNPPEHSRDEGLSSFSAASPYGGPPALHVSQETASALLDRAGLPDLAYLQGAIDATGEPASQVSGLHVVGGWKAQGEDEIATRNIVGMVRGEGPTASEYVVIGGHYDHVGRGEYGSPEPGEVHNGADDNASGTAAVLEVAEAYAVAAQRGRRPARSIVFALFTAEELGLVGSRQFVANLPVPAEKVVAMVNLDMVGRVRDQRLYLGNADSAPALRRAVEQAAKAEGFKTSDEESLDGRSDHAPFLGAGIPAVFLFSGGHDDYHRASDDADTLNYDGLTRVARAAMATVDGLAAASREDLAFSRKNEGVKLGVSIEPGDRVVVGQVMLASPAGHAGVRRGDVIVKLDGNDVPTFASLVAALSKLSPGDTATLAVERDGKPVDLRVTFPGGEGKSPSTLPVHEP